MIPVVDVEYYGDKEKNPPPKEQGVSERYGGCAIDLENERTSQHSAKSCLIGVRCSVTR